MIGLAKKADVTFVQETHGKHCDTRRLQDLLRDTHKILFSPYHTSRAGGLLTIIKLQFLSRFDTTNVIERLPGRLFVVDLLGRDGRCRLTNLHNDPCESIFSQRRFLNMIFEDAPAQHASLHVGAGDFNFVTTGDARLNANEAEWSEADQGLGGFWENTAANFTE